MQVSTMRSRLDLHRQVELEKIVIKLHNIDAELRSFEARQSLTMIEKYRKMIKLRKQRTLRQRLYVLLNTSWRSTGMPIEEEDEEKEENELEEEKEEDDGSLFWVCDCVMQQGSVNADSSVCGEYCVYFIILFK